jgi:hypothetical protein
MKIYKFLGVLILLLLVGFTVKKNPIKPVYKNTNQISKPTKNNVSKTYTGEENTKMMDYLNSLPVLNTTAYDTIIGTKLLRFLGGGESPSATQTGWFGIGSEALGLNNTQALEESIINNEFSLSLITVTFGVKIDGILLVFQNNSTGQLFRTPWIGTSNRDNKVTFVNSFGPNCRLNGVDAYNNTDGIVHLTLRVSECVEGAPPTSTSIEIGPPITPDLDKTTANIPNPEINCFYGLGANAKQDGNIGTIFALQIGYGPCTPRF